MCLVVWGFSKFPDYRLGILWLPKANPSLIHNVNAPKYLTIYLEIRFALNLTQPLIRKNIDYIVREICVVGSKEGGDISLVEWFLFASNAFFNKPSN
jgi:hypothetical protein